MDKQYYILKDLRDYELSQKCVHPLWIKFTTDKPGVFPYYCVCAQCFYLKLRPKESDYAYQESDELFGKIMSGGPIINVNYINDKKEVLRVLKYYRRQFNDYLINHPEPPLPEHVLAKQFIKELKYGGNKDE